MTTLNYSGINWGHKLVFFMVLFMLFIISMVVFISRQKVELVDANYYERGINYQQELNKYALTEGKDYTWRYESGAKQFHLRISEFSDTKVMVRFYRPSDSKLDFETTLPISANGDFSFSTKEMVAGLWKVVGEWQMKGKQVAFEKELFIQ